jgi:hypothetical protein
MTNLKEMAGVQTAQLKCLAGRGMFPHESAVLIRGVTQHYEAMIDSELINLRDDATTVDERQGVVEVQIIKVNEEGHRLVELPRQVVNGGRRIWVPVSEIE